LLGYTADVLYQKKISGQTSANIQSKSSAEYEEILNNILFKMYVFRIRARLEIFQVFVYFLRDYFM
jgi:hypothetical protein